MCGNFSQLQEDRELAERYGLKYVPKDLNLHGSIFPGQEACVVINSSGELVLKSMKWGLVPSWVKDEAFAKKIARGTFNARSETLAEKPSFKRAFKASRCLIPAKSFFEFLGPKGSKDKYSLGLKDGKSCSFAGLYERWKNLTTNELLETFTIVTCESNELVSKYHPKNRMPVMFTKKESEHIWLEASSSQKELVEVLKPIDSSFMEAIKVS